MAADSPVPERQPDGQTLLFVYGTLKRGQSNHGRLQEARWLGDAILEGACLFDLGPFPMAIAGQGHVAGELYAVATSALPALDAFEGCPRLYQRHWRSLVGGRQAWAYLGQPRQVRHVRRLEGGRWPEENMPSQPPWHLRRQAGCSLAAWLLLGAIQAMGAQAAAFDTLGACQAWRSSRGSARIELANAIGAAHYLTKRHRFEQSPPDAPVALYSPADIQRVCGRS